MATAVDSSPLAQDQPTIGAYAWYALGLRNGRFCLQQVPHPSEPARRRIDSIDLLRGIVTVIMMLELVAIILVITP